MVTPWDAVAAYEYQPEHLLIFATLILLEGVLSFDNAAVLAAMVRKLPPPQRKRALLYGLAGAYVFRIAAIFAVSLIIRNKVLLVLGGSYLVYLAVKHLFLAKPHAEHGEQALLARFGISGFWGTVVAVELADIAFALDQVLAAVAMVEEDEVLIIVAASIVAILFLRISASYMVRLMDWFPALEKLAYVAVGFVGLKLLAELALETLFDYHLPYAKAISVSVTFSLLVVPVVGKLVQTKLRGRRLKTQLAAESRKQG